MRLEVGLGLGLGYGAVNELVDDEWLVVGVRDGVMVGGGGWGLGRG